MFSISFIIMMMDIYIYIYIHTLNYLKRLASRSHSSKHKISPSRHGPLTLRMILRLRSSRNVTRTCVTLPVLPVLPNTLSTCFVFIYILYIVVSMFCIFYYVFMHIYICLKNSINKFLVSNTYAILHIVSWQNHLFVYDTNIYT